MNEEIMEKYTILPQFGITFMNACKEKYNVYPIIYCNEVIDSR